VNARVEDNESDEGIEAKTPGGFSLKARGKETPLWVLIIALVGALGFGGWTHAGKTSEEHAEIKRGFDEVSYLLSLPQAEREKLNLNMPESLRSKTRRRRDE
jgi:hypothetical protein